MSGINNPITGVFGTGQMQFFSSSGTFTIPPGIGKVRVRLWGGGGGANAATGSSGGGFALKTIYDLSGVTSVAVTVGAGGTSGTGGTSSFGSYVSAMGGTNAGGAAGAGVNGDINTSGGTTSAGGAGAGSLLGNGGGYGSGQWLPGASGVGLSSANAMASPGILGQAGAAYGSSYYAYTNPTSGQEAGFSIDFIGTGGGGTYNGSGINGGGGGYSGAGGYPGGGGGNYAYGAPGLVIVEY